MTAATAVALVGALLGAAGSVPGGSGADPAVGAGAGSGPTSRGVPGTRAAALGSVPATSARSRDPEPVLSRGPSTRIEADLLAADVGVTEAVRIVAVHRAGETVGVTVRSEHGRAAAIGAIKEAQSDAAVLAVEVDRRVTATTDPSGPVDPRFGPTTGLTSSSTLAGQTASPSNDTYRDDQWALDRLAAEQVWTTVSGAGQVVAVIDTGVDGTHPDLAGQVLAGTDLVEAGGNGWDDGNGHGTHVAGIVAALAGNAQGVAGFAPGVKILPIRSLDDEGSGWDSDTARGVIWAADHGATVVNLSLGGPRASDTVRSAVSYAVGRGVVVLAAAGNERSSGSPANYPAALDLAGLGAVAATTSADVSASYSTAGSYVDLAAPGDHILSTLAGGSYATMSGTSMATPYAAAAAALVRAGDAGLDPAATLSLLTRTAADLETAGWDTFTGSGLIDVVAALCAVDRCPPGASSSPTTSPTDTPSDSASPTDTPTSPDDPGAEPVLALTASARAAATRVIQGRSVGVTVSARDAAGPVVGAIATVSGYGRTVSAPTGSDGVARLSVVPNRTGTWTARVTAAGHAAVRTTVVLTVVPAVSVRWSTGKAVVTVKPALRQTVSVWSLRSGKWVRTKQMVLGSGSSRTVTLTTPRSGRLKVVVGAVGGLGAVTVTRG